MPVCVRERDKRTYGDVDIYMETSQPSASNIISSKSVLKGDEVRWKDKPKPIHVF